MPSHTLKKTQIPMLAWMTSSIQLSIISIPKLIRWKKTSGSSSAAKMAQRICGNKLLTTKPIITMNRQIVLHLSCIFWFTIAIWIIGDLYWDRLQSKYGLRYFPEIGVLHSTNSLDSSSRRSTIPPRANTSRMCPTTKFKNDNRCGRGLTTRFTPLRLS